MAASIHRLADQMQFENDLILAKKYMRRVGTEPHRMKAWERRVKELRMRKLYPKKWAAERRAMLQAKQSAEQLNEIIHDGKRKRMTHVTIDKKSQPIYEEDIENNIQEKDWMDEKAKPALEGEKN